MLTGPANTLLIEAKRRTPKPVYHSAAIRSTTWPASICRTLRSYSNAGEWSDWQRVSFPISTPGFLPDAEAAGICRFYLQQVHPTFRLYVSAVHIDPSNPGEQRITTPADFSQRIAQELDLFGTLGFQEDHKAFSNGVFTSDEFKTQADFVLQERLELLEFALRHYDDGLLFFYFSSTDLQSHMFWWETTQKHPTRSPDEVRHGYDLIVRLYERMDDIVGQVAARIGPRATLLVMSDHGFCNFGRQFDLNIWLRENGYLGPATADSLLAVPGATAVDWGQTRAYGIGLNALYVNLSGREEFGIVKGDERNALLRELKQKLLAARDPENGEPASTSITTRSTADQDARRRPDYGYRRGYRSRGPRHWAVWRAGVCDNDVAWPPITAWRRSSGISLQIGRSHTPSRPCWTWPQRY